MIVFVLVILFQPKKDTEEVFRVDLGGIRMNSAPFLLFFLLLRENRILTEQSLQIFTSITMHVGTVYI